MKSSLVAGKWVGGIALCAWFGAWNAGAAVAQTLYVISDQTVANGNPINGSYGAVNVGFDSTGTLYPNVHADIVSGASLTTLSLEANSIVNMTGGAITNGSGQCAFRNTSTFTMSGGSMACYESFVFDSSTVTVTGGTVNGALIGQGSSTISVSNGNVSQVVASGTGDTVRVTGGTIGSAISQSTNGRLDIAGGTITGNVSSGGYFASNTLLNITGGTFLGNVLVGENSAMTISGGIMPTIASGYYLQNQNSSLTLVGTGIICSNPVQGIVSGDAGTFFTLTGTLLNGDKLNTRYYEPIANESAPSHLTIMSASTPEPMSLLFIAIGGGMIVATTMRRDTRQIGRC